MLVASDNTWGIPFMKLEHILMKYMLEMMEKFHNISNILISHLQTYLAWFTKEKFIKNFFQ